jgi:hypothetical protein
VPEKVIFFAMYFCPGAALANPAIIRRQTNPGRRNILAR